MPRKQTRKSQAAAKLPPLPGLPPKTPIAEQSPRYKELRRIANLLFPTFSEETEIRRPNDAASQLSFHKRMTKDGYILDAALSDDHTILYVREFVIPD